MFYFKRLLILICLFISIKASAQTLEAQPDSLKIINDNIDKAATAIALLFINIDSLNIADYSKTLNNCNANIAIKKVDNIQDNIETDSLLNRNKKLSYLNGFNNALTAFESDYNAKKLTSCQLPVLIDAWQKAMSLSLHDSSILTVVEENEIEIGSIIINFVPELNSKELDDCQIFLVLKSYEENPDNLLPALFKYPEVSIADSLIKIAARTQPENLYTYSQAINRPLGKRIQHNTDTLVKLVATFAQMKKGRMYFPFLDDLYTGKISAAIIKKILIEEDKVKYYKLLVQTQIEYAARMEKKDTPVASNALMEMLAITAMDDFINTVNGLHGQPDNIRLKVLQPLNAQDLYYLCIAGNDLLFTSSYIKIYDRIFYGQKLPYAFTLLKSVHFDHYKRFIKMASGYNTLDDFLEKMDHAEADSLIKSFVSGLQDPLNIEDAVDVADSYASINNLHLRKTILDQVQKNLASATLNKNESGKTIYGLLNSLFLSMDTANNIDISALFGIPPVYQLNNNALRDSAGIINILQFFYGDEDGQNEFNNFLRAFQNPNWKIIQKKNWVEMHSVKGVHTVIYSNKPLDEKRHLDSIAREDLYNYLESNNIHPSIIIHRGHSYYVKYTIQKIPQSAKLIFLGSCGGYNNLSQILKTCPYAQIISTKQAGTGYINQPMIVYLTEQLRQGKNLNWPEVWKVFANKFKYNKDFEDYIPPHENLGAIFIMAYYKAMEKKN